MRLPLMLQGGTEAKSLHTL